jgi:exopolysaccharide biosynthesis predicted pyruvyltransferase EpsI
VELLLGEFFTEQQQHNHQDLNVLLVDPAYHANVGDHMLTLGELEFLQRPMQQPTPIDQCYYVQAGGFYPVCTDVYTDSTDQPKLALWHAGGNWGDLWRVAQEVRMPSFRTILQHHYRLLAMPQSLFYLDPDLKQKDSVTIKEKVALGLGLATEPEQEDFDYDRGFYRRRRLDDGWDDGPDTFDQDPFDWKPPPPVDTSRLDTPEGLALAHSKVTFTWREQESYEEAKKLYPFVRNMVVPDIAFQLGPYAPIRKHPKQLVDVLVFLRADLESKVESIRNDDYIKSVLSNMGTTEAAEVTFRIVDWPDRLDIFGTRDEFFTETSIELLSLGKVVVCDRLHAAILAYLAGLPFVYIDQISGKITKTLGTAFGGMEDCMDGEKTRWAKAGSLKEALTKAVEFIDHYKLEHNDVGIFGGLKNLINF